MLEWPNRRDWKSRVPSQGEPWVRIPPSPPGLFAVVDKFGILNKKAPHFQDKGDLLLVVILVSDFQKLILIGRKIRYE